MTDNPLKQMRSMDSFIKYLIERDLAPQTVIDVGACYGTPELFRNLPTAYHIYFEPIPWMEELLKLLTTKFPGENLLGIWFLDRRLLGQIVLSIVGLTSIYRHA